MKISVIIPVYNVEKYLTECVNSILMQSYKNIEVVLVNDGSTDNSPELCNKIQSIDKRVIVIHKKNGGLSDARNEGIKQASGDYIFFLDSDDFFDDKYAIERIVNRINLSKAEVINFSYKMYYESMGKTKERFINIPEMPLSLKCKSEQINYLTKRHLYIASACNKAIKRTVFKKEMLFEEGKLSEDVEWCARLLFYAKSFDFVCENFYCYRQREGSITHTIGEKACMDLAEHICKCVEIAKQAEEDEKICFYRYVAYQLSTFLKVQAIAEKCPVESIEKIKDLKWLLAYHEKNKKVEALYIFSKPFGLKIFCKLIRITKKVWG